MSDTTIKMDAAPAAGSFEALYLKERNKGRWLLGAVAALSFLLIGSLAYGISGRNSGADSLQARMLAGADRQSPSAAASGNGWQNSAPAQGGNLAQGRQRSGSTGGFSLDSFFQSDGSVDTGAIGELLAQVPEQMRSRVLDRFDQQIEYALSAGEISGEQAEQLRQALTLDAGGV